jgi:hypothetical protein
MSDYDLRAINLPNAPKPTTFNPIGQALSFGLPETGFMMCPDFQLEVLLRLTRRLKNLMQEDSGVSRRVWIQSLRR